MTDGQQHSQPAAPSSGDAPVQPKDGLPSRDTRPADDKIATTTPLPESTNNQPRSHVVGQGDEADADGDSEAETLIESPEKKKLNILESAPRLEPSGSNGREVAIKVEPSVAQSAEGNTRKRKRSTDEGKDGLRRHLSRQSSPLSSSVVDAHSGSELGSSARPRNAARRLSMDFRRPGLADRDSKDGEGRSSHKKGSIQRSQKRRKSEFEDTPTRPLRQKQSPDTTGGEKRETRSATYSRSDSLERSRSLSPRPRTEHRRKISTQSIQTLASHKARRVPAPLNTRRNRSSDRSSDESVSPAPTRPQLHKFASNDTEATSPAKVMAKKLRDKHGRTQIAQACTDDKLDRVKQMYEERPQDLNLPDNAGNTPLQIAALQGHVEIVEFLLQKHADPNTRNIEKETALIDAVENGHIDVVKILLKHGADPRIGNATGQKPLELVDPEDGEIRKLLLDAKSKTVHRRQSEDQAPTSLAREGSSRAASAASPRDSPPIHGPKSPPPLQLSRRRARDPTRNDLLWQANTPENLTKLAGKGDTEGVVNILNILNKASPEALIAACKGGHDEVLQLLIAMGDPDPDPDPVTSSDQRKGYNTPILAAIGEGKVQNVKLLIEQDGFNPTRTFKGRTYYELAQERKGDNWKAEYEALKRAYEMFERKHPKQVTPRKAKDADRHRIQGSSSPMSQRGKSPQRAQADSAGRRERPNHGKRVEGPHAHSGEQTRHLRAVSSDHDRSTPPHKSHKTRRSKSDLPTALSEEEVHKKRRLFSRKEQLKGNHTIDDTSSVDEKTKKSKDSSDKMSVKRRRSSFANEPAQMPDISRMKKRSRRALSDSSPEEVRTVKKQVARPEGKDRASHGDKPSKSIDRTIERKKEKPQKAGTPPLPDSTPKNTSPKANPKPSKEHVDKEVKDVEMNMKEGDNAATKTELNEKAAKEKEAKEKIAKDREAKDKETKEAKDKEAREKEAREKVAQEQATKEKEAAEQQDKQRKEKEAAELAVKQEEQRAAAEVAARQAEEARVAAAEQLLVEEAAAAKKKAEEEATAALARKKEEEERQERLRREAEEKQRRAEERRQRILREAELKRMEALPHILCRSAKLLEANDPDARNPDFLKHFLPLFTMKTKQIDPHCSPEVADERWTPGFQVAPLLGVKNLGLEHLTHWEKRTVSDRDRFCLWRVGKCMLMFGSDPMVDLEYTFESQARLLQETWPKFEVMQPLVWVKVSSSNIVNVFSGSKLTSH